MNIWTNKIFINMLTPKIRRLKYDQIYLRQIDHHTQGFVKSAYLQSRPPINPDAV